MTRQSRNEKPTAGRDEASERIVRATVAIHHEEQDVATTLFAEVAEGAGGSAGIFPH